MSKTWILLVILSVIFLLSSIGYQIYISSVISDTEFTKVVNPIPADLGKAPLKFAKAQSSYELIRNPELDNK